MIEDYMEREKETLARLKSAEGEVNTHFLTRQFLVKYDSKHAGDVLDMSDPLAYMSKRADVFDRCVSRYLRLQRRETIVRSPNYNRGLD